MMRPKYSFTAFQKDEILSIIDEKILGPRLAPLFVVVVLPNNAKEFYEKVKHKLTVEVGVPSQCVVSRSVSH